MKLNSTKATQEVSYLDQTSNLSRQNAEQWNFLAEKYGANVCAQKDILIPMTKEAVLVEINPGDRILDVGCGNGLYTELFQDVGAVVTGIDISEQQINRARLLNPDGNFFVQKIEAVSEGNFDVVFANMLICNLPSEADLENFFLNAYRVTKDEGILYVTNVSPDFQKTCSTKYIKHAYPSEVKSGVPITVSLTLVDGSTIGPFVNYHFTSKDIEQIAFKLGYKIHFVKDFRSVSGDDSLTYRLFSFIK